MKISRRVVSRMILGAPIVMGATLTGSLGGGARADEPQKPADAGPKPDPEPTALAQRDDWPTLGEEAGRELARAVRDAFGRDEIAL